MQTGILKLKKIRSKVETDLFETFTKFKTFGKVIYSDMEIFVPFVCAFICGA